MCVTTKLGKDRFTAMDNSPQGRAGTQLSSKPTTIGRFLGSGLQIEDQLAESVYRDYLDRSKWPERLSDDAFDEIGKRLTVLLDEVQRHKRILLALIEKHGDNRHGR